MCAACCNNCRSVSNTDCHPWTLRQYTVAPGWPLRLPADCSRTDLASRPRSVCQVKTEPASQPASRPCLLFLLRPELWGAYNQCLVMYVDLRPRYIAGTQRCKQKNSWIRSRENKPCVCVCVCVFFGPRKELLYNSGGGGGDTRGSIVGWDATLQSTQPLTEMSTRNLPVGKVRPTGT
jgi:hypothetical protein